jgi:uncharacterized protein
MHFEWDPRKAARKLDEHRVSFDEASSVFYDLLAVTGADPNHSEGEERMVTFGMSSSGNLLVVSRADRGEQT